jgi:integrase
MRMPITTRAIEALHRQALRQGKDQFLWDTGLKGFGAKATAKGHVSWLVQKWEGGRDGKAMRIVIGHYPQMTVDEARIEALVKINAFDKDIPLVSRKVLLRQAKEDQRQQELALAKLGDTMALYVEKNRKPGKYWRQVGLDFERDVIPALGRDTLISSVTKAALRDLIEAKQAKAPAAARGLYAALRPFFNWCVERDLIAVSPLKDVRPPAPVDARDRVLTETEIKLFWKASSDLPIYGSCYRLLLLTAQRREEVGAMSWSELDLAKDEWVIPKERAKNGKAHLVHLSPQAIAILRRIPKLEGIDFVFPGKFQAPISGHSDAKKHLDNLMPGVADWRIHDLRRTAASGMAALGFQPHVIERVLNHVSGAQGGLVGVYQRYEYQEDRRRALEAWGLHIEALVSDKPKVENVVPLRVTKSA